MEFHIQIENEIPYKAASASALKFRCPPLRIPPAFRIAKPSNSISDGRDELFPDFNLLETRVTEHRLDHEHDYTHIAKSRSSQGNFESICLIKTKGTQSQALEGNKRFVRHPTRLAGLYLSRKGDELKSPFSPLSLSNPANWGRAGRRGAGRQRRGHCIMLLQSLSYRRRRARGEGESKSGHVREIPLCLCCERERPFPQRDHPIPAEIEERGSRARSSGGRWMDWVIWIWANVSKAKRGKRWPSGQTRNFPALRRRSEHYLLSAPPSTVRLPK